ncbi:hypothetical protein OIU85_025816 [Salix viminalis]|uniref:Uncharacterized protein n=1 Tax=Salix viminalis TaxID=40686 RepID=A0A9Q0TMD5_SALVM|nr:hypothetical protein OIU85_025816 [Salix viminalis]
MVTQESKDPFKGVDWKAIGGELQKDPSAGTKPVIKKRLPKKIRQIPDYYFLPRLPLPTSIAFYGACIAGGVGAGMLLEMWINKKVKEDGGIIWDSKSVHGRVLGIHAAVLIHFPSRSLDLP